MVAVIGISVIYDIIWLSMNRVLILALFFKTSYNKGPEPQFVIGMIIFFVWVSMLFKFILGISIALQMLPANQRYMKLHFMKF